MAHYAGEPGFPAILDAMDATDAANAAAIAAEAAARAAADAAEVTRSDGTYGYKVSLVVDAAGSGDHTTIAAAIAAVPAGGADIFVKRGTYTISGIIVPSKTTLRGEGDSTIIKLANGADTNTISTANGSTDITIRDLRVDGNKANNTLASGNTIAIFGSNTKVLNCHVVNSAGYGIVAFGVLSGTASEIVYANNIVEDSAKDGLELQGASRSTIVGNVVKNAGYSGIYVWAATAQSGVANDISITGNVVSGHGAGVSASGIRVDDGVTNCTVSGNTINNAGTANSYGIAVYSSTATAVSNCTVTGNTVRGANQTGIQVQKATYVSVQGNTVTGTTVGITCTATCSEVNISGNTITATTNNGIYVLANNTVVSGNVVKSCGGTANDSTKIDGATGVTYTGNRVSNGGGAGLLCTNAAKDLTITGNSFYFQRTSGIYLLDCNHFTISGNTCRANGQQGVGSVTSNGITLYRNAAACGSGIISGNRCYDDQGTKTQAYGVRLYQAVDNVIVGPNQLIGNATGTSLVDGTATAITTVTPV